MDPRSPGIPHVPVWDVVVVGAGPAGAMVALELSRAGKRVLLLDRQAFPRWKVCGATVSPGVVGLLMDAGLGGLLPELGATSLHTLRLGGWSMQADVALHGSAAISRQALDAALVREAVRQGAHFYPETRVRLGSLFRDRRTLEMTSSARQWEVSTRAVVAADGLGSGLMAQAGEPSSAPPTAKRRMVGLGCVFPSSVPDFEPGVIHMALGEAGYVGLVRVENGHLNLAAAVDSSALKGADSPAGLVGSILRDAGWPGPSGSPRGGWKGTPELTRRPGRPGAERLFAVGDAGGYVEPFTGEGVLWALSGARALAPLAARAGESWESSLLDQWTQVHSAMVGRAQRLCGAISWTLARPLLSKSLLRVFRKHPRLAGPVVRRVGSPIFSSA